MPATPDVATLVKDYKGREAVAAGEDFDPSPDDHREAGRPRRNRGLKTALLAKKTRGETVDIRLKLRFGNAEGAERADDRRRVPRTRCSACGTAKHDRQQLAGRPGPT